MDELKSCPFCGGKPFITTYNYIIDKKGTIFTFAVECNGCHAVSIESKTEEEAIKAWNRRV